MVVSALIWTQNKSAVNLTLTALSVNRLVGINSTSRFIRKSFRGSPTTAFRRCPLWSNPPRKDKNSVSRHMPVCLSNSPPNTTPKSASFLDFHLPSKYNYALESINEGKEVAVEITDQFLALAAVLAKGEYIRLLRKRPVSGWPIWCQIWYSDALWNVHTFLCTSFMIDFWRCSSSSVVPSLFNHRNKSPIVQQKNASNSLLKGNVESKKKGSTVSDHQEKWHRTDSLH